MIMVLPNQEHVGLEMGLAEATAKFMERAASVQTVDHEADGLAADTERVLSIGVHGPKEPPTDVPLDVIVGMYHILRGCIIFFLLFIVIEHALGVIPGLTCFGGLANVGRARFSALNADRWRASFAYES